MNLETIIAGLSAAYLINNSLLPVCGLLNHKVLPKHSPRITEIENQNSPNIEFYNTRIRQSATDNENALAILYAASKAMRDNRLRKRGDISKTNCREISQETYANFLYWVNKKKLPQLKDYVRLVVGSVKFPKPPILRYGHEWLEHYNGSDWEPFESHLGEFSKSIGTSNFEATEYFRLYAAQQMADGKWKYNISTRNIVLNWHSGLLQLVPGYFLDRMHHRS